MSKWEGGFYFILCSCNRTPDARKPITSKVGNSKIRGPHLVRTFLLYHPMAEDMQERKRRKEKGREDEGKGRQYLSFYWEPAAARIALIRSGSQSLQDAVNVNNIALGFCLQDTNMEGHILPMERGILNL